MKRLRTALAVVLVSLVAAVGLAAPASAHDVIVSSSPAADAQLDTAPTEVTLTFSNQLLSLDANSGTAMTVTDADGRDWVGGDPEVAADAVTVPLEEGMPAGAYTVTWQVVSSDGHPTSGEYSFTVVGEQATATPTPSATPTSTPTVTPSAESTAPAEQEPAPWPLLIGLGVVLLLAVGVVIYIQVRKKR